MKQRTLALALAPFLLAAPSVAGATTGSAALAVAVDGELAELVAQEAAAAKDRAIDALWERSLELRDAASLGEDGELDRALDALLGQDTAATGLGPKAIILLSAARLLGDEPDLRVLVHALQPWIGAADDEVALAVATIFKNPVFRGFRPDRDALVDDLLGVAEDAARSPRIRLAHAEAAHVNGSRQQKSAALHEMDAFLESSDAKLRALGALTLAGAKARPIEGRLARELGVLAKIPDATGELAESYLERERLREHLNRKVKEARRKNEQAPAELAEFDEVLRMIEALHLEGGKVKREDLLAAAMDGMLRWMDPHSSYMSSEVYAKFFQDLEAEYSGIGAYVNEDPDNGLFTIIRPIYSGPAYRAGLKTDDKIVRIDDWPTLGEPVDEIIKRLKGKPGTSVTLYVWRRGMDGELIDRPTEDMAVTVERASIEIPSGSSQLLPGGIALLELDTFSKKAMQDLRREIVDMKKHGMRGLILDMRANSGGLLTQAREVAELFLPPGERVVSTEGRGRDPEVLETHDEPIVPPEVPVVILTGRFTASAAEIVSGALQDHHRAELVGKRTFGKGSVQQLLPVLYEQLEDVFSDENRNGYWDTWEPIKVDRDGDGEVDYAPRIKLTIAKYLLPSGRSIHRELDEEGNILSEGGVEPDYLVDVAPLERWRYDELRRIDDDVTNYVDDNWADNRELFSHLAVNDGKDFALYPNAETFYQSLSTTLSHDDVRRRVRAEVRRRVQDDRGAEFPRGDFVEDVQVQKAIQVVLDKLGESPSDVTEYGLVFDFEELAQAGQPRTDDLASLGRSNRNLDRARALILEARNGGSSLSKEELDEVLSILEGIEKN